MIKVNRKVEYGLVALKHMRNKDSSHLTSVREICERYGTPFDPVAHVLRILNANGLVRSEQGAHGGYRLVCDLERVNLAAFMEMIEGQLAWTDCLRDDEVCRCSMTETCNIITPMHEFNQRLTRFLESISLADLLQANAGWGEANAKPTPPERTVRATG
ncbi:MAG: Rrf2 family transcriptional regulator [SAR324 cluster bacterium]|nr:Rrf2 family transcriptional regulator [SAR324 cluster bacterium]